MQFDLPLIKTRLVKRYKRFLADVEMPSGEIITVHCANPGSMLGLTDPGNNAWISDSQNPKRKLRYSLEIIEVDGVMVGINTSHPNKLAKEAIEANRIPQLSGYETLKTEVKYGENSRIDILLQDDHKPDTYVEVKNVHFIRTPGLHEFPDSVTARGAKHLDEMAREVEKGNRAVMLYVIQRNDGDRFQFASDLDPNYFEAFQRAHAKGVEAIAIRCNVGIEGIEAVDLLQINDISSI
jgi:sugar fermentation stimulation protein A